MKKQARYNMSSCVGEHPQDCHTTQRNPTQRNPTQHDTYLAFSLFIKSKSNARIWQDTQKRRRDPSEKTRYTLHSEIRKGNCTVRRTMIDVCIYI